MGWNCWELIDIYIGFINNCYLKIEINLIDVKINKLKILIFVLIIKSEFCY